jgi:arylsulfatase A-like enzyme/predicted negative regulator of RcsB-dependent stress response
MRADHLGCYGYGVAQTPVLDGLAGEGILYNDAVATYPMTLPSHASILTGLHPPNHGVRNNGEYRLSEDHTTLAEVLKGKGYETVAFIAAFVLDARYGLDQGFEVYDDEVDPATSASISDHINERSATRVTDAALEWLRGRDQARPFFAWVHYFDPHQPYRAPEPYARRFPRRPYDAETAYMDSQVGRLLRGVEEAGLKSNTLIIAVGDHGEGLGDHSESTHGVLIYDSVMRVPLIVSCPSLFQGPHVVHDAIVSTLDIYATVVDLLGVGDAPPSDGLSLLAAGKNRDRGVYMECMTPYLDNGWAPLFGLRRHKDKYILAPGREYFDLRDDPGELNNLYVNPPARLVEARDSLVGELDRMMAKWPSLEEVADMALVLDPESLARLESLGYVSTASPDPSLVTLDPKDMMPIMDKILEAKALTKQGRLEEAVAAIQEAADASPRDRTVLYQIARLYVVMGRTEEAEKALREYIAIRPRAQALVLLAQILILDREFEEANRLLLQAKTLEPQLGMVYIAHGDFAKFKGRLKEARDSYLHAMEVDPYRSEPTVKARLAELRDLIERLRQKP